MISNIRKHRERSLQSLRGYYQPTVVSGEVDAMINKMNGRQKKNKGRKR